MSDDPYSVLGVDRSADIAQIRRAYLRQLRDHHPDLHPGDALAQQRTAELNRAWQQVSRRHTTTTVTRADHRPRSRPPQRAYSTDRRHFRVAFTTATLRVALAVLAIGLVLLIVLVR